jgi:hypothetical protein
MKKIISALTLAMLLKIVTFAQPLDSLVIGIWLGEYLGYDPQTQSNITVRRRLIIEQQAKLYYDTLWGQPTGSDEIIFEMEIGNWEFNFTFDSIIWTPIISKHIDIANPDSLVEYDHGVHRKELNEAKDQWQFHDNNMNVDYLMLKEEFIETPGTPAGNVSPVIYENYVYTTSGAASNLDHLLEYSFNWGDGSSSGWSSGKSSTHAWTTTGLKYVTVTARCQDHNDRTATSDSLAVDVRDNSTGINNGSDSPYSFKILNNYPGNSGSPVIISYNVPVNSYVSISIYNIQGQLVRELLNGHHDAGNHEIVWDGKDDGGNNMNNGIYLFTFTTKDHYNVQKSVLVK